MNLLLLNRDFKLPADNWYQVAPLGEYSHSSGITQVLDAKAAESMVNRFKEEAKAANFPGLLVDFDHFSDDEDKPSAAAGWIDDLQNRADGVWAQIRWSAKGRAAVEGGDYRLVSPVWRQEDLEVVANSKKRRPLRLLKVALTNDPNLRGMVPLSNRQGKPLADNRTGQPKRKTMKSVCALLGLSAEADEQSVHAEVTKLQNRARGAEEAQTPLKNRVAEIEKERDELLKAQVESDLDKYKNRFKPEAKDKVKAQLLKNRAETIELLESMPETAAPAGGSNKGAATQQQPIHNRATAKAPEKSAADESAEATSEEKARAKKIANRAHAIVKEQGVNFREAWKRAEGEYAQAT